VVRPVRDARGRALGFAKITRDMTEQREAQQALYDSEHRFRLLVQAVKDCAIYMLDPSGVIVNWNSGAERLKGYSAEEIVGQHFSKFYTREDRMAGLPARVLDAAARDGHYEVEGWRVRKDGGRFWAAVEIDAIRDENNGLLGFAKITRDITERQVAQQTLRDTARQFRTLIGGVTDYALFMLDPNGLVVNWNAGAERIKGYSAGSTFRASTPTAIVPQDCRRARCKSPRKKAGTKRRAGAFARTVACFGPMPSSIASPTKTAR
jgi:PAS domain S-box-containing protein